MARNSGLILDGWIDGLMVDSLVRWLASKTSCKIGIAARGMRRIILIGDRGLSQSKAFLEFGLGLDGEEGWMDGLIYFWSGSFAVDPMASSSNTGQGRACVYPLYHTWTCKK